MSELTQIEAFQDMVTAANTAISGGFNLTLWWDRSEDIEFPALVVEELGSLEWNYFQKRGTISFELWNTYDQGLTEEQNLSAFSLAAVKFIDAFWSLPITEGYLIKPRLRISSRPDYFGEETTNRLLMVMVTCDFGINE